MGIFGESDGDREKRLFKEEVKAHESRMERFHVEARLAGFTFAQIEFMATFLALSEHSHQYYSSPHWRLSSPPVDGNHEDRES